MEHFQALGSSAMSRQAQMCGEPAEKSIYSSRLTKTWAASMSSRCSLMSEGLPASEVFESMDLFAGRVIPNVRVSTERAASV
jgi:hypothetical protein